MNDLNLSQSTLQQIDFNNIYKDFELQETLSKTKNQQSTQSMEPNDPEQTNIEQMDNMIRTLPFMNDNIRANIKLGIEIYKQLNNIDRNYIHEVINGKSINYEK